MEIFKYNSKRQLLRVKLLFVAFLLLATISPLSLANDSFVFSEKLFGAKYLSLQKTVRDHSQYLFSCPTKKSYAIEESLIDAIESLNKKFTPLPYNEKDYLPYMTLDNVNYWNFRIDALKALVKYRLGASNDEFIAWFKRAKFSEISEENTDINNFFVSLLRIITTPSMAVSENERLTRNRYSTEENKNITDYEQQNYRKLMDENAKKEYVDFEKRVNKVFSILNKNNDIKFVPSDNDFLEELIGVYGVDTPVDHIEFGSDGNCGPKSSNSFCVYQQARIELWRDIDSKLGRSLLEKSASMGNPLAQFELAQYSYFGTTETLADPEKAFKLFHLASRYIPAAVWWTGFAKAVGYELDRNLISKMNSFDAPTSYEDITKLYSKLIIAGDHSPQLLQRVLRELRWTARAFSHCMERGEIETNSRLDILAKKIIKIESGIFSLNGRPAIYLVNKGPLFFLDYIEYSTNGFTAGSDHQVNASLKQFTTLMHRSSYLIDRHRLISQGFLVSAKLRKTLPLKYLELRKSFEMGNTVAADMLVDDFYYNLDSGYYDQTRGDELVAMYAKPGQISDDRYIKTLYKLALNNYYPIEVQKRDTNKALSYINTSIDYQYKTGTKGSRLLGDDKDSSIMINRFLSQLDSKRPTDFSFFNTRIALQIIDEEPHLKENRGFDYYSKIACQYLPSAEHSEILDDRFWNYLKKENGKIDLQKQCVDTRIKYLITTDDKIDRHFELGMIHLTGFHGIFEPNYDKATQAFLKSAKIEKNKIAGYWLARLYDRKLPLSDKTLLRGKLIGDDNFITWIGQSDLDEVALSSRYLGYLYFFGGRTFSEVKELIPGYTLDTHRNTGLNYLATAIERGDYRYAPYDLGRIYKYGLLGVPKDPIKARNYYEISYAEGDIRAGSELLITYSKMITTPLSHEKALKLSSSEKALKLSKEIIDIGINVPPLDDENEYAKALFNAKWYLSYTKMQKAWYEELTKKITDINSLPISNKEIDLLEKKLTAETDGSLIDIDTILSYEGTIEERINQALSLASKQFLNYLITLEERVKEKYPDAFKTKSSPEELNMGKFYALVIGNSKYEYLDSLKTPANDAAEVSKVLKNSYGFTVETIYDGNRKSILDGIHKYIKKLKKNDSFLLYYAGHGEIDKDTNTGYWQPVDADIDTQTEWIDVESVSRVLKRFTAKNILVVADSCFSGVIFRGLEAVKGTAKNTSTMENQGYYATIQNAYDIQSRMAFTSGGVEPVVDAINKFEDHSMFARAFLDVLRENPKKAIKARNLAAKVTDRAVIARNLNKLTQTPEYGPLKKIYGHEGGDFIFRKIQN